MKKKLFILAFVMFLLTGCSGGKVSDVDTSLSETSTIYSQEDIEVAYQTVIDYFESEFDGCTLTQLYYPGDTSNDACKEWARQYKSDEAIVLLSSFDVDSSGGDGSLNPHSTYDQFEWILVRDRGEDWKHVDHGY